MKSPKRQNSPQPDVVKVHKIVEVIHHNKAHKINTFEPMEVFLDDVVITDDPITTNLIVPKMVVAASNNCTTSSDNASDNTLKQIQVNETPKVQLPKANIEIMEDYPKFCEDFRLPSNFIKFFDNFFF